jgi:hypothetical protein
VEEFEPPFQTKITKVTGFREEGDGADTCTQGLLMRRKSRVS